MGLKWPVEWFGLGHGPWAMGRAVELRVVLAATHEVSRPIEPHA